MPFSLPGEHSEEAIRFFLISAVGLSVDIAIAWALIALAGAPDAVAAVVGFSIATVMNYFGHQLWTFQKSTRRPSMRRFLAFAAVVIFALSVRLLILDLLGPLLPGRGLNAPTRLGLAATVCFFVTFILSKFLIFHHRVYSRVR